MDAECSAEVPDLGADVVGSDNCSAVVFNQASVGPVDLGANTVVLTATDEAGNETTSDVLVTLLDTTPPAVEPLDPQTVSASATCDGQVPSLIGLLKVTENCPGTPEIVQSLEEGTALTVGSPATLTFVIKDASGNQTELETTITLVDELAPVLGNVPETVQVPVDAACAAVMPDLLSDLTAGDNCAEVQLSQSVAVGTALTLGEPVVVTISATDGEATVTAEVTVTAVDTTGPVFDAESLGPLSVVADEACSGTMPTLAATATDACGTATVTQDVEAGAPLTLSEATTVTVTATDAAGNKTVAEVAVTLVDQTPPVIGDFAATLEVPADEACAATVGDLTSLITGTDACGTVVVEQVTSPDTAALLGAPTTVVLTVTDAANNTATAEIQVTMVDLLAPTWVDTPQPTNISADSDCSALMPALLGTAIDNCGAATLTQSPLLDTALSLGETEALMVATDDAGNAASTPTVITVVDDTPPVLAVDAGALAVAVDADAACAGVLAELVVGATDNCTATDELTTAQEPPAGQALTFGMPTSITLTVNDGAGNSASQGGTVTLVDVTPPTITTVPAGRDIPAETGCLGAIPDLRSEVVANDNCPGELTISQTPLEGVLQNEGDDETLTFTAADTAGNASGSETATVTLVDPSGACGDQGTPDNGPEASEPPELPDTDAADPDTSGGGHNADTGTVVEEETPPIQPLPDGCGCRLAPGGPTPLPMGPAMALLFAAAWLVRRRNKY